MITADWIGLLRNFLLIFLHKNQHQKLFWKNSIILSNFVNSRILRKKKLEKSTTLLKRTKTMKSDVILYLLFSRSSIPENLTHPHRPMGFNLYWEILPSFCHLKNCSESKNLHIQPGNVYNWEWNLKIGLQFLFS